MRGHDTESDAARMGYQRRGAWAVTQGPVAASPVRCRGLIWLLACGLACVLLGLGATEARAAQGPGSLDPSFGASGTTLTDVGSGGDGAKGLVRESDGSLAVVGSGVNGPEVAHYSASGTLDSGFGSNGVMVLPTLNGVGGGDILFQPSIAYQPTSGDLIVAGTWNAPTNVYAPGDFGAVALKPDGSLDTSFGTNGYVDVAVGTGGDAYSVAVDAVTGAIDIGGTASVSGSADMHMALLVLSADGTQVSATTLTHVAGEDAQLIALAPDGSAVDAVGEASSSSAAQVLVTRYTSTSVLDSTFNGGVPKLFSFGDGSYSGGESLFVQSDHKVVIGGYGAYSGTGCLSLARVNPDGSTDTSFGSGGTGTTHLCAADDSTAYGVAGSSNGYLYIAGNAYHNSTGHNQVALARFGANGTIDTSFGSSGLVLADPAGASSDSQAYAVTMAGTEPVIAGPVFNHSTTTNDFMLQRYLAAAPAPPPSVGAPPPLVAAPTNTAAPTIDAGTAGIGQRLTGAAGSWTGSPTEYLYKWYACPTQAGDPLGGTSNCHAVQVDDRTDGTTTDQYTVTAADTATRPDGLGCTDTGCYMRLVVVAFNGGGSTPAVSAATQVDNTPPVNIVSTPPSIDAATAGLGQMLTGSAGSWTESPTEYLYKWYACPTAANGPLDGTDTCHAVQVDDNTNAGTTDQYRVSTADLAPRADGTGCTTSGCYLRLLVIAFNAAGGSAPALSAPTTVRGAAPPGNTMAPSLSSGIGLVRRALTATAGSWTGDPSAYAFRWQRCPSPGAADLACATVRQTSAADASSDAYTPVLADAGQYLRVAVEAENAAGSSTAYSNSVPVLGAPAILGAKLPSFGIQHRTGGAGVTACSDPTTPACQPVVGDTLIGHGGEWSGSGSSSGSAAFSYSAVYTYTWLRCGGSATRAQDCATAISQNGVVNENNPPDDSYTLTNADFGARLALTVRATNPWTDVFGPVTAYSATTTSYVDDASGTLHHAAQSAVAASTQGAKQLPVTVSKTLAGSGPQGGTSITLILHSPADILAGGVAHVIAAGAGNVIAAGAGNVIAAGAGNVIAAGAGNVIAAGGGNVIAAGGGNVIAAGGGNRVPGPGAAIRRDNRAGGPFSGLRWQPQRKHRKPHRKVKLVALFKGAHKFVTAGRGKLVLRLTPAGRRLLRGYERQARIARRHHHRIKPIHIGFVTVVRPLHGKQVGVASVRYITLHP